MHTVFSHIIQKRFSRMNEDVATEALAYVKNRVLTTSAGHDFAIALDIPAGEERAGVVRSLVDRLKAITAVLVALPPKTAANVEQD